MSRIVFVILLAAVSTGCVVDPISPNIWSLARTDANNNETYLGGHYTLESCQKAGVEWFTEMRGDASLLQCRLNCRKTAKDGEVTCEATQPVG